MSASTTAGSTLRPAARRRARVTRTPPLAAPQPGPPHRSGESESAAGDRSCRGLLDISRKPNGKWELRSREGGQRRSRTFDRKGDATAFEAERIRRKQLGHAAIPDDVPFREFVEPYWAKRATAAATSRSTARAPERPAWFIVTSIIASRPGPANREHRFRVALHPTLCTDARGARKLEGRSCRAEDPSPPRRQMRVRWNC